MSRALWWPLGVGLFLVSEVPLYRHVCHRSASEKDSHLRLTGSCITQLKAPGPSRTCNESEEDEEKFGVQGQGFGVDG